MNVSFYCFIYGEDHDFYLKFVNMTYYSYLFTYTELSVHHWSGTKCLGQDGSKLLELALMSPTVQMVLNFQIHAQPPGS